MNFKVGENIACIRSHDGIVRGKIYEVIGVRKCPGCKGRWVLVNQDVTCDGTIRCGKCHHITESPEHWYDAGLFKKLHSDTCHDEILEKFKSPEEQPDIVQIPHEEEV